MKAFSLTVCLLVLPFLILAENWPSWRKDHLGSGQTSETKLPTTWGPKENVLWRTELPEPGNSTPVIWGEHIYVTQPESLTKSRSLLCFDRKNGELLWKNGVIYEAEERSHRTNHYCSASPTANNDRIVVSFGSAGIICYDHDGKELWQRDFGPIDHTWGNSTSPVLLDDVLIHYHGPATNAVLYGLNPETGETIWEWKEPAWKPEQRTDGFNDRPDQGIIGAFSTPILVETKERRELIMSFPMEVKAFNPATGDELWACSGLNPLVYTSPMYAEGIVVAMGGYYGNSIGVKVGGNGDVTKSHRLWQEVRHTGGIGSGITRNGKLFYQDAGGIAYCDDMKTGKTLWRARLPGAGKSWGSFIASGDLIYTLSQAGDTVVFKASEEGLKVVSQGQVDEQTNSSLVVSNGEIFIRTHEALWCISTR